MANHCDDAGRWLGRVAAFLMLVPALGLSARAEAPDDKASEVVKAFKQLQAAVRNDARDGVEGGGKTAAAIASRPAKTITPPTLDAAAIDAMLEKGLATAKAARGPADDRRGVRASRLARRDGQATHPGAGPRVRPQEGQGQACRADRGPAEEPGLCHQLGALLARRGLLPRDEPEPEPGRLSGARVVARRAVRREPAVGRRGDGPDHRHRSQRRERGGQFRAGV